MKCIVIVLLSLFLSACIQPPKPLRGEYSDISPQAYQKNPQTDLNIRWTGFVIEVENKTEHSCLTIIAKVPDERAKPSRRIRVDKGRFIACKPVFFEPESFMNKPVTVTGTVKRLVSKTIDELKYDYPLVDAEVVYVW
ncbi:Slp family lipoprotein [Marinicella sp. S1101]|uniref:Slp family lipoprotein n=1 Tax=Marinicella marina TaxID=2996016 RepID=UPI0022609EB2|nr:Slp family lipoprotein [Marinicella marina]MCX7553528.1 Slp family lipoprotein [Marinicella marina]MDJ1140152.1 Slp family lipoprotein [Marinicella marina]